VPGRAIARLFLLNGQPSGGLGNQSCHRPYCPELFQQTGFGEPDPESRDGTGVAVDPWPFDRVFVASFEVIDKHELIEQLAVGGRLLAIVCTNGVSGAAS